MAPVAPVGGIRRFVGTPVGRAAYIAFAILVTFAVYAYVSVIFAIPVLLIVGLALPVWLGAGRLRFVALLGIVVILIAAPLVSVVYTQEIMVPLAPASSPTDLPGGGGGALMQNASVHPYVGSLATNFTWNVTLVPQYIPKGNESPYQVTLYLSTCPGATGTGDPNCASGYPFYAINQSLPANLTAKTTLQFHFTFPDLGIWSWQMGAFLRNSSDPTGHNVSFILLVGDPTYDGLEGPVVGNFASTWEQLLPTVYVDSLVYLGLPYYVILLIYLWWTRHKARRGSAVDRAPGPVPAEGTTETGTTPGGGGAPALGSGGPSTPVGASAPRRIELPCPQCGAVVYPNETKCWKCGAPLTGGTPAPAAPLP